MINESQTTEIRTYLLTKKLAIDLLIEVQDHFIEQIEDLENNQISFEEAFEKVKKTWFAELRFSKYQVMFDNNNTTIFERKLNGEHQIGIMKKSSFAALCLLLIFFMATQLLTENLFFYFFISFLVIVISAPIITYFWNFKLFQLVKKYDNYKLTWSQQYTNLSLIFVGCYLSFFFRAVDHSENIYNAFMVGELNLGLVTAVLLVFLFLLNTYSYFSQIEYLKQIKKVEPFLKYLNPSKSSNPFSKK